MVIKKVLKAGTVWVFTFLITYIFYNICRFESNCAELASVAVTLLIGFTPFSPNIKHCFNKHYKCSFITIFVIAVVTVFFYQEFSTIQIINVLIDNLFNATVIANSIILYKSLIE